MNPRYIIGIDTGSNTGFAVFDWQTEKLIEVETTLIHRAQAKILQYHKQGSILVRVEDARLRTWIPKEANLKARVGRAKGAGSVSRDAVIWQDFLKDMAIEYELVAPKNNITKVKDNWFETVTGWKGRTSSHSRDAGMMAYRYKPLFKKTAV